MQTDDDPARPDAGQNGANPAAENRPQRIQLKRSRGWRIPPNTVKVDRTTRWGNPMVAKAGYTASQAVQDYRIWLQGDAPWRFSDIAAIAPTVDQIRTHLRGKNLACWCAPDSPCHAQVLLEIANA